MKRENQMEKVRLGEVCKIVNGSTPSRNVPEFWDGKINWFTPKDLSKIEGKYLFESPEKITDFGYKSCSTTLLPVNSLLFTSRAPIGHIAINRDVACTNQGFKSLVPINCLNVEYLYYAIKRLIPQLKDMGNGATFKELSKSQMENVEIPLPPLEEQKRIATLLDTADVLRQKDKALLQKYDALAQSLFLELFGDPVRNEKGWEIDSTIKYCGCIVPGRDKPKSFTGDIPWVTTNDLNHLGFTKVSKTNLGLSKNEILEVRAKLIPTGSVILTCVGDLGKISINTEEMIINQQLHAFQCSEKINNIFLMYSLSFQTSYMNKMASSTTVPYMNKTVVNSIPTICPPIELQNQFAEQIQLIEKQKALVQENLAKSEALFMGLLGGSFN